MREIEFFREMEHIAVPWRDMNLWCPVFYYDVMSLSAQFLAPTAAVKALLPSTRLHPIRVTPWHSIVAIIAFQYRDCDLGPYNELGVTYPVTLDRPSPMFTGLLRKAPAEPWLYVRHLPVTTEIARVVGVEFAGFPKILADIEFAEENDRITCRASHEEQTILTLSGRKLPTLKGPRLRIHNINARRGRLLRCEFTLGNRQVGGSTNPADLCLELGDHPIGRELKALKLGRLAGYEYEPRFQGVLTPVIESLAA